MERADYPTDLAYPGRTDPIVTEPPGEERFYNDQPGTIEKVVDQIGVDKEAGGMGEQGPPADRRGPASGGTR